MSNGSITYDKVFDWIVKGIVAVFVPILIYILSLVGDIYAQQQVMNTRVTLIENTRFTTNDGYTLERSLDSKLDAAVTEIKLCMNKIQRGAPCD